MPVKPVVLAVIPSEALPRFERALASHMDLLPVHTVDDALIELRKTTVALIICGMYVDDSRLFDSLIAAKVEFPPVPFVCCRFVTADVPGLSKEAVRIACEALGVTTFIDMPAFGESDEEAVDGVFRSQILSCLRAGDRAKGRIGAGPRH